MEEAFEEFKKQGRNSVDGLIRWLQGIKLIEKTQKAEERARNLFQGITDVKNVDFPKFLEVVNKLAEEQKKNFDDVSKALVEDAPRVTNAFKAGISAVKDLFKRQ